MNADYNARKNEVLASYEKLEVIVSELQEYAKNINLPDPMERLGALLSDIRGKAERVKADRFNIIIAGESKSGKSTFINAYLGVELLPMDVKQCTSAIVEIKYGKQFAVKATYADDRVDEIKDETKARAFLKKNAALDDDYRDIPVPTINSEILVKAGWRAMAKGTRPIVHEADVEAMLNSPEVKAANIHNIPDYNDKIWSYINTRINTWRDIVIKIEVTFPFVDEMRGIEIIDSPGVCARGGVSEITSQYIENADAIIFLKPVIGQSLESEQFNQFMENVSVARNKNALFLVLTHIATKNDADIRRLEEEAYRQFSSKLDKRSILFVDSKAELFAKHFAGIDDIESELRRLNKEGKLDDFVTKAYTETNGLFGNGDINDFINKLHEKSRFDAIYQALNTFGRKAHYILLAALLDSINSMYSKLWNDINFRMDMFRQKAEDPTELAKKIAEVKLELEVIQNKMYKGVNNITRRFLGDDGIIKIEGDNAVDDFLSKVKKISPNADDAFDLLAKHSIEKIDYFNELQKKLHNQVIEEFDNELIALSDKNAIPFESIKPDFTEETFKAIQESTKEKAIELFKKKECFRTRWIPKYTQNKHFGLIKSDIEKRLGNLKKDLTENLNRFVENISTRYIAELAQNADAKKVELDAIMEAKATAEQIQSIIKHLSEMSDEIATCQSTVKKIGGGIIRNVQ